VPLQQAEEPLCRMVGVADREHRVYLRTLISYGNSFPSKPC
jgi:hypothetical protein